MKKWFYLALIFSLILTSGCKKKEEPPHELTEEEKIQELLKDELGAETFRVYYNLQDGSEYKMVTVDLGYKLSYPTDPIRNGYKFTGWYLEKECVNKFNFSKDYIVESTMLYAGWEEVPYVDYNYIFDEYLPSEISESILLPRTIDGEKKLYLTWKSSDEFTITNEGLVNQGREDITIHMTLEVNVDDVTTSLSKDVVVKAVEFSPVRENKAVFGYYSFWNFAGYSEDSYTADVINVSFGYLNSDFTLDLREITPYLHAMLEARQNDTRVVLSIAGSSGDRLKYFSNAAKTVESRKKLASEIVKAVEKYHFDGVDLDWEYPGTIDNKPSEAANYTALVKEIYTQLKQANEDYILSAAIPGGAEGHNRYELKAVSEYLDYIHLMTYDMEASSRVYHHTALYSNVGHGTATQASVDSSVEIFTNKGVPISKLVIGIAFYGKYTTPAVATNGGLGGASANSVYKTITYTQIAKNYLNRVGKDVTYFYDEICHASYLYDKTNNVFVTYESEVSIKEKCDYARKNGLGGVMIWELGEDTTGTLLDATLRYMKRK